MAFPSLKLNLKNEMNQKIFNISNYLALKQVHYLTQILILLFFFTQVAGGTPIQSLYTLFALNLSTFFFRALLKEKKTSTSTKEVLPLLTAKYQYTSRKSLARSLSFLLECLILFAWQLGHALSPYENIILQYTPITILIASIILRLVLPILNFLKLRHDLTTPS